MPLVLWVYPYFLQKNGDDEIASQDLNEARHTLLDVLSRLLWSDLSIVAGSYVVNFGREQRLYTDATSR